MARFVHSHHEFHKILVYVVFKCQTYYRNYFNKIRKQVTFEKSHPLKLTFTSSNTKSNPYSFQKIWKGRKLLIGTLVHLWILPKCASHFSFFFPFSQDFLKWNALQKCFLIIAQSDSINIPWFMQPFPYYLILILLLS